MVAPALAVALLTACAVFLVVFRRAFRPAFPTPDELAQWATRLNVTEVRFSWSGQIRHVAIDPLPRERTPLHEVTREADDPHRTAPQVSKVDAALAAMLQTRERRSA